MRKRKNAISLEFYGSSELIRALDKAGADVKTAISEATVKGADPILKDMQSFMAGHYRRNSISRRAFANPDPVWDGDKMSYKAGYDLRKGAHGALFLDVGTPFQQPYHFVHKAVFGHLDDMKKLQVDALMDVLKRAINDVD